MIFVIGSASGFPIIRNFSVMCSICVASMFVYQCTFLLAIVIIDDKRQQGLYNGFVLYLYQHEKLTNVHTFADEGVRKMIPFKKNLTDTQF